MSHPNNLKVISKKVESAPLKSDLHKIYKDSI